MFKRFIAPIRISGTNSGANQSKLKCENPGINQPVPHPETVNPTNNKRVPNSENQNPGNGQQVPNTNPASNQLYDTNPSATIYFFKKQSLLEISNC